VIGKTIGDYLILEKRGEGGMGMFFKARDVRLDRLVGLKTIRAELLHEPEVLAKLEEEAKSLARLDHPNIARLLHYMVIEDQRYIVMEYVEGSDLAEKLRREGPLSLDLLRHIVPQICAAIGYAHNKHVIHRDIKPSNILLTDENTVKVTDFGIAKILGVSAKTKTGVATGSLPYMAPEQIRGTGVDARTDIYQLGVLLFELLTGRRPFQAETEYDMMSHHLSTPPPTPSSINPNVSRVLDEVVLKALAKNPDERFGSAGELANVFKDATAGADDSRTVYRVDRGPGTSLAAPGVKRSRKRLVGGIIIGVLAVLAFAKLFLFDEKDVPQTRTSTAASVEVVLSAHLPSGVEPERIKSQRLLVTHPSIGTLENDSVRLIGDRFEGTLSLPAADSMRFTLSGYGGDQKEIVRGESWVRSKNQSSIRTDLRLVALAPQIAEVEETERQPQRPIPDRAMSKPESGPTPTKRSADANLILDVSPFTERERIESIWIDDKKIDGKPRLETFVKPGHHTIRWRIGDDLWTDTVTTGSELVEKNLIFEMSRGRINVTATFPGGSGYADVVLDGRTTGVGTPGELREIPAGPHEVVLKIDGYRMRGGPYIVRVPANERARINIEMVRE
jgi:serine/threonine protein kinase